jgi:hypothetical protein
MYYDTNSGYWVVKGGCGNVSKLPPITFYIGGAALDLQPQQWTRPVRKHPPCMLFICKAMTSCPAFGQCLGLRIFSSGQQ